jgi:predicted MFS family arabinose efflux permease
MSHRLQLTLFFCAIICFTTAMGVHESIFNNYLRDTFAMSAGKRGWLELPRELPGFLVVLMAGILCMLPVTHLGVVGTLTFAAGMIGIMLAGARLWPMMAMMMVGSAGLHLIQPTESSISLALSGHSSRGRRMGQVGMIGTLGTVLGSGLVWLAFDRDAPQYQVGFACAAAMAAMAAVVFTLMHIPHLHQPRPRLVVRRRYWLYYLLEALFGARKQIFITFGVWVLISVYGQPATGIAQLIMIASVIGIVFKPLAGAAIDRFGERTVMIVDGVLLAGVCIGYGYAMRFAPNPDAALTVARGCFIADNLLFALGTSRAVYLSRIVESPGDLTSTLALGVSINHLPSMTVPAVAGAVWEHFGYERVFLAAAVLALVISAVSTLVPRKQTAGTAIPVLE